MGSCIKCKEDTNKEVWIKRPVQRFKALGVDVFQCWHGHTWKEPMNEAIPAGNYYYDEEAYESFVKGLQEGRSVVDESPDEEGKKVDEPEGGEGDDPIEDLTDTVTQEFHQ